MKDEASEIPKSFGQIPKEGPKANEEQHQEAFFYLGVLSATFASIEIHVQHLLGVISGLNIIDYQLIEDNSLGKNLQLLKKMNRFHQFKIKEIEDFIKGATKLSEVRNTLIHGRWEIIVDETQTPFATVWNYKIKFSENDGQKLFERGVQHAFTFPQMADLITNARALDESLKDIIADYITRDKPGARSTIRGSIK